MKIGQKVNTPHDIDYFAEKIHDALNNGLGVAWTISDQYYSGGPYKELPDRIKNVLRHAAMSVLDL